MNAPESIEDQLRELADGIASLEGFGKPLSDLGGSDDPGWWAKKYVRRSQALDRAVELQADLPGLVAAARALTDPAARLDAIDDIRAEISAINEYLDPSERLDLPELRRRRTESG